MAAGLRRTPTVIYVAGSGRSGSTLLERTLGEITGFVNVGELIDLFRRVVPEGERCGCGEPFGSCPFWTGVGLGVLDGWDPDAVDDVRRLQVRVARQRHIPRLMFPRWAGSGFNSALCEYGARYRDLYTAIAAQGDAQYVVDASKWPVQALALHRAGLDVRVIHLVRDPRGVAHSLGKENVARPHTVGQPDVMFHESSLGAAARWLACQTEADALARCGLPVVSMRYEDFVADPRAQVRSALRSLRLCPDDSWLSHIGNGRVSLRSSHGLSGNPSRFRAGDIVLQTDLTWRTEMRRRDQLLVAAVAFPQMLKHQLVRSARGKQVTVTTAAQGSEAKRKREDTDAPRAWPLVSVILATRGRPELIRESIRSVVVQTYPGEIECIVVHDQEETDPTLTALGTERHSVTVVSNTHAPGLAGARNTAVERAAGAFVATCDDDDVWHPTKLEKQIDMLLTHPDLLVVGSGIRLLFPAGKITVWPARADHVTRAMLLRNRVKEMHSSTLVMRRDAFAKVGQYDELLPFGYAEDYDWVLRASRVGRLGAVREPLADIRKDVPSWYRGRADMTATALPYFLDKHPEIASSRRGHARILGQIAFAKSVKGERLTATRLAGRALRRWPLSPHAYLALAHVATGVDPGRVQTFARRFGRGLA